MRSIADLEEWLDSGDLPADPALQARQFLDAAEEVLENWVTAHGGTPTDETREGFRLLALHRQGAKGDPSFNACRETCREVVYHYNLLTGEDLGRDRTADAAMMRLVTKHLALFIGGKLQEAGLGDFCCSSRSIRTTTEDRVEQLGADNA